MITISTRFHPANSQKPYPAECNFNKNTTKIIPCSLKIHSSTMVVLHLCRLGCSMILVYLSDLTSYTNEKFWFSSFNNYLEIKRTPLPFRSPTVFRHQFTCGENFFRHRYIIILQLKS